MALSRVVPFLRTTPTCMFSFKKIFSGPFKQIFCFLNLKGSRTFASLAVPGEPTSPTIKTTVPGPKSKELLAQLENIQASLTKLVFHLTLLMSKK